MVGQTVDTINQTQEGEDHLEEEEEEEINDDRPDEQRVLSQSLGVSDQEFN